MENNSRKKIHRFFVNVEKGDVVLNDSLILIQNKDLVKQLKKVLKISIGEKIVLLDGFGGEYFVEILGFKENGIETKKVAFCKNKNESVKNISLYCAILKKENFEMVVQKAVEIGVKKIIPLITDRTVKLNLNTARLEKIAKESAEQSERGIIPTVSEPLVFDKSIALAVKNDGGKKTVNLFFDVSGKVFKDFDKSELFDFVEKDGTQINIFIGPEGGWSNRELDEAKRNNFKIISLGKLTFRAETAAIIASYLLSNI